MIGASGAALIIGILEQLPIGSRHAASIAIQVFTLYTRVRDAREREKKREEGTKETRE